MKKRTRERDGAGGLTGSRSGGRPSSAARTIFACGLVLAVAAVQADTVAEWKFDGKEPLGADQVVPLDHFLPSASGESVLMAATSFSPDATGISDKWAPFLQTGFLDAGEGDGKASANQHGLVTKNTQDAKLYPAGNASYRAYLGFAGLGSEGRGASVFLVVSPKSWASGNHSLFGTGHLGGQVFLSVSKGELRFVAGQGGSGTLRSQSALAQEWETDAWYFVGISWSGGQNPVLYVRKMDGAGAGASPEAVLGTASGTVPEIAEQPRYDPLVVGARWVNTGGSDSLYTLGGANARIAYARVDNGYSTEEDMEAIFLSLGSR
jgi:hypothetical protein